MSGLKRGAVVVLRSGGPEMVIERIDTVYGSPDRYALCKWFDRSKLRSERFAVHVLELSLPAPEATREAVADPPPVREPSKIEEMTREFNEKYAAEYGDDDLIDSGQDAAEIMRIAAEMLLLREPKESPKPGKSADKVALLQPG